jgi:hypothetical protein
MLYCLRTFANQLLRDNGPYHYYYHSDYYYSSPERTSHHAASQQTVGGLSRLFTKDKSRECRCEAASFLAAYVLGMPCFALAATTVEALKVPTPEPFEPLNP